MKPYCSVKGKCGVIPKWVSGFGMERSYNNPPRSEQLISRWKCKECGVQICELTQTNAAYQKEMEKPYIKIDDN